MAEICRKHGISDWHSKYGGMEASEAKRLKALEDREQEAEEATR
jgi:putative transposase